MSKEISYTFHWILLWTYCVVFFHLIGKIKEIMKCPFLQLSKSISFLMLFSELKWYLQKLLRYLFSEQFCREFWSINSSWNWRTRACRLKIIVLIETSRATTGIWVNTQLLGTQMLHMVWENRMFEWNTGFMHIEGTIQMVDEVHKGKICSVTWIFLFLNDYFVLSH